MAQAKRAEAAEVAGLRSGSFDSFGNTAGKLAGHGMGSVDSDSTTDDAATACGPRRPLVVVGSWDRDSIVTLDRAGDSRPAD